MSFFKYYPEREDADGVPLWWPGGPDGFPYRGKQPPQTTAEEYANMRLTGVFRCQTFYLDNEEDLKQYKKIRDKCANGLFIPVDRDRQWVDAKNTYRVYLEWLELAYDTPPVQSGVTDAVRNYTQTPATSVLLPYRRLAGLRQDW
jgi:hypothetical protein